MMHMDLGRDHHRSNDTNFGMLFVTLALAIPTMPALF